MTWREDFEEISARLENGPKATLTTGGAWNDDGGRKVELVAVPPGDVRALRLFAEALVRKLNGCDSHGCPVDSCDEEINRLWAEAKAGAT
jgi:hypothetical protein